MKYEDKQSSELLTEIKFQKTLLDLPALCYLFFLEYKTVYKKNTLLDYAYAFRFFFNYFCDKNGTLVQSFDFDELNKLTEENLREFYNFSYDAKGLNSTRKTLFILRTFYNFLVAKKLVKENLVLNIRMPKRIDKQIVFMSESEMQRILDAVDETESNQRHIVAERDKTILMMFLHTGLRLAEVIKLNVGDIDIDNGMFTVMRKFDKHSTIYISDNLKSRLKFFLENRKPDEPLFMSNQNKRFSPRGLHDIIVKYRRKAGITKNITAHKFRSTFGVKVYSETKDIYLTADLLDHFDVRNTTRYYVPVCDERKRNTIKNLYN